MLEVVKGLLRQAASVGIKPSLVLLDRGFYAVQVIRYLQCARLPFLMPVKLTGRKADHPKGPSGTRVFTAETESGWHEHTIVSGTRRARGDLRLLPRPPRPEDVDLRLLGGRGPLVRVGAEDVPHAASGSSRATDSCTRRGRTASRRPELRLLYVGLSLVLRGTNGCGCTGRCSRRRGAAVADSAWSDSACERSCAGSTR